MDKCPLVLEVDTISDVEGSRRGWKVGAAQASILDAGREAPVDFH
jgi:hypothetical protein